MADKLVFDLLLEVKDANRKIDGMLARANKGALTSGKTAGASFSRGFSSAVEVGMRAVRRLFFAGAAGVTAAGIASTNFQASMKGVQAVLQGTAEQYDIMSDKAVELGKKTKFSASESANAMEVLARNGLKYEQIMDGALESTLDLAAATGTDLANAADIVTDAINIFKIELEDMDNVVNGITGTTVNSKFAIDDYRLALARGGGVAAAYGVTLDEFNTAIAATASQFNSGMEAGTGFKVFLQRLIPQSKEAQKVMEKYNLSFFEANGEMKSMADIQGILRNNLKDLSDEQKAYTLKTIFGSEAQRFAVGMINTTTEEYAKLNEEISKVDAAKQAETRIEGVAGAWQILKSNLEAVSIELFNTNAEGKTLIEWVEVAIRKASEFISTLDFEKIFEKIANGVLKFGRFVAKAGKWLFDFIKQNKEAIKTIGTFVLVGMTIGVIAQKIYAVYKAVKVMAAGFQLLLATNPVLLGIIAGLVALAVATTLVIRNWNKVKASVDKFMKTGVGKFVKKVLVSAFDDLKDAFKALMDAGKTLWKALSNELKPILKFIGAIVGGVILIRFKLLTQSIKVFVENSVEKFKVFMQFVRGLADLVVGVITLDFKKAFEGGKNILYSFANFFISIINAIIRSLNRVLDVVGLSIKTIDLLGDGMNDTAKDTKEAERRTKEYLNTLKGLKGVVNELTGELGSYQEALLDKKQADLDAEQAQKDYNDAVKEYGENSREAEQALINKIRAERRQEESNKNLEKTQGNVNKLFQDLIDGKVALSDLTQSEIDSLKEQAGNTAILAEQMGIEEDVLQKIITGIDEIDRQKKNFNITFVTDKGKLQGIKDGLDKQFGNLNYKVTFTQQGDKVVGSGTASDVTGRKGSLTTVTDSNDNTVQTLTLAEGGLVSGGNNVPTLLNDGKGRMAGNEYVVNAPATNMFLPMLEAMNNLGKGGGNVNNSKTFTQTINNYGNGGGGLALSTQQAFL